MSDFFTRMRAQARIERGARMLPPPGEPITDEQHDLVREDFLRYTDKTFAKFSRVARETGLSKAVISTWAKGTYKGDNDRVTRLVHHWINEDAQAQQFEGSASFVTTRLAEDMRGMARLARAQQRMVAIVSPSGTGKTMLLRQLTESMSGIYIYSHEDLTPFSFLRELCKGAGVTPSGRAADMMSAVVDRMRDSRRPLFLDEAHILRPSIFSRVRAYHDQTGCPVVMTGTDKIIERINDRAGGHGQMASRTLVYNAMDYAVNAEGPGGPGERASAGRALFSRKEIQAFFDSMAIKVDPDAFEMLYAVACLPGHGCIRTMMTVVELVYDKWRGEAITRGRCLTVLNMLVGPRQGEYLHRLAERQLVAMRSMREAV